MALRKAIQVEWVAANMEASGRIKGYRYIKMNIKKVWFALFEVELDLAIIAGAAFLSAAPSNIQLPEGWGKL